MSVKLVATAEGALTFSSGDIDLPYGIASLSKLWASALLYDRLKEIAAKRKLALSSLLDEPILCRGHYEAKIYERMEARPDLTPPDDPLTYRPFRKEKSQFCFPVEQGKSYTARALFEAALFPSKNDAIQLLTDHFIADDDNLSFRKASSELAQKLGLKHTKIGDPHGLCDGDNVSTARDLAIFCSFLIEKDYLDFFALFDPKGKIHTAEKFLTDERLGQKNIQIILAKTATGNDRHGNESAESALVIAKVSNQYKIALTLSDANRFETLIDLLSHKSL